MLARVTTQEEAGTFGHQRNEVARFVLTFMQIVTKHKNGHGRAVQGKELDQRTGSSFIQNCFVDYETLAGIWGLG